MFTGWIYDHLKPHAAALKVAHPLMLRANCRRQEKERPASTPARFATCLRCDFSAGVLHGPDPRFANGGARCGTANLLVRQMVQMKNKIGMLLMEAGVSYNKQRLHKAGLFPRTAGEQPGHRCRAGFVVAVVPRGPWCACRKPRVRWCDHSNVIRR